jgi:hypothetical protein
MNRIKYLLIGHIGTLAFDAIVTEALFFAEICFEIATNLSVI